MKLKAIIFVSIMMLAFTSFNSQTSSQNTDKQTEFETGVFLFKTESGYLYVFNFEKDAYQIELKGVELKYFDEHIPLAFYIDNKFINLLFVLEKNYWKIEPNKANNAAENDFLAAHKTWERDYFSERYKTELSVTADIFNLKSDRKVMYWSLLMPETLNLAYTHQTYLTTLVGKNIVGISGTAKSADDMKKNREYLIETMNTLKVSEKPFNIQELRKLHKELNFGEDNF